MVKVLNETTTLSEPVEFICGRNSTAVVQYTGSYSSPSISQINVTGPLNSTFGNCTYMWFYGEYFGCTIIIIVPFYFIYSIIHSFIFSPSFNFKKERKTKQKKKHNEINK